MTIKIAENIRNLRKANSFTQEQLAEALGVTVGAVYKWESGLSMPEVKLILEIADFFEVSVDTLLGYEQQNGKVENRIQKIKKCLVEMNFEEGVAETEKALKKYPNNFQVVYSSAMLYMLKFSVEKNRETMLKSNELFEKAISLLYQNTEKSINKTTILNYIASNYLSAGEKEKALEILEENNICNINSGLIGYIYGVELKQPKEAESYLCASMAEIINRTIRTAAGKAFVYAQANDRECISVALWLMNFLDSLKERASAITFGDKYNAVLLAQCAVWEASFANHEKAKEYIENAYAVAKQFDAAPVYNMEGINFFKGMESEGVSFDGIGKTAIEAVENFVFQKDAETEPEKQVWLKWEELKGGCSKS